MVADTAYWVAAPTCKTVGAGARDEMKGKGGEKIEILRCCVPMMRHWSQLEFPS